jgi:hypothetical protein
MQGLWKKFLKRNKMKKTPMQKMIEELTRLIQLSPSDNYILSSVRRKATELLDKEKTYNEEEALEFHEWVSDNDWVYLPSKGYWVNEEQEELEQKLTTRQLFEEFKENQ